MGKIQVIQKSRKENRCGSCRELIPVGSKYFKGVLRFQKPIIRCVKCGLKHYEVTTSDYIRNVGRIVEDWHLDYDVMDGVWEDIADALQEIRDECEEKLYNMPEQLQESDNGQTLQERIDSLEAAIDGLQSGCMDDFLVEAYEELSEEARAIVDEAGDEDCYEEWYATFFEKGGEAAAEWKEATENAIADFVNQQLEEVSY